MTATRRPWASGDAVLLLGMTALGFANIVVRYGTNHSFAATEELLTGGFVLLTVFGAAIAARLWRCFLDSFWGLMTPVVILVGSYSGALLGLSSNEWVILAVIMLVLLICGMFMDAITIMLICLPVARDPVWFGVLVMVNLAIGLITPPVGINLYVAANITRLPLEKVARGALLFLITSLIGLPLIAAVPALSLIFMD